MYFYSIALLGSPLEPLTYHSENLFSIGAEVEITLSNRAVHGVVIDQCEKPDFKTSLIVSCSDFYYSDSQIKTAQFMSDYYGCSLGEALNLFIPYTATEQVPLAYANAEFHPKGTSSSAES